MTRSQDLIFGVNPVFEKLKASSGDVIEIYVSEIANRSALRQITREAARRGVRVVAAEPKFLDQLVGKQRHQGVVARTEGFRYLPFAALLQRIASSSIAERILILDGVTDPRNFGALLRTAEAAGVRHVVIPKDRSVAVTPLVAKASAGAAYLLDISKVTNLRRAIAAIKEHGYWIAGLEASKGESLYQRSFPARLAMVLGSEGTGVRPINLKECDFLISIPMLGKVQSLNVSVAGAVVLYELLRQSSEPQPKLARS